ncbi:MAG: T9SS type A sorting domain-containing protein [Candidatus Eisenbacteria sp.]|nr:T9SS type A sorting domain-containing protein [Candidatus Eisenbacteria bacterium]
MRATARSVLPAVGVLFVIVGLLPIVDAAAQTPQTFTTDLGLADCRLRLWIVNSATDDLLDCEAALGVVPPFLENVNLVYVPASVPAGMMRWVEVRFDTPASYDGFDSGDLEVELQFVLGDSLIQLTESHPIKLRHHLVGGDCVTTVQYETGHPRVFPYASAVPDDESSPGVQGNAPRHAFMGQSFPNPAVRSDLRIPFGLPQKTIVSLRVYDLSGRLVRTLHDQEFPAGYHILTWDGCDNDGGRVSSGVYFYELALPKQTMRRSLILLR